MREIKRKGYRHRLGIGGSRRIKKDSIVGVTGIEESVQQFLSQMVNTNGCEKVKGSHLRELNLNAM